MEGTACRRQNPVKDLEPGSGNLHDLRFGHDTGSFVPSPFLARDHRWRVSVTTPVLYKRERPPCFTNEEHQTTTCSSISQTPNP